MSNNLNVGDLALVIPGKGANNVRNKPNGTVNGQIPEHAVLAILPRPADWTGAYGGTCAAGRRRNWPSISSK